MAAGLVLCLVFALLVAVEGKGSSIPAALRKIYDAKKGSCDFFVAPNGSDKNYGTDYDHAFLTLGCALDPACNEGIETQDVVCLLAGTYNVRETITPRLPADSSITIKALGDDLSVILDGGEQVLLLNTMSTAISFRGIVFQNGAGNSGGAVYGERHLRFEHCIFRGNTASIHGGAVMGGRNVEFVDCLFEDNSAKYAGAVRVSDIGSAKFDHCQFLGNEASDRGGAIATQIETPETHSVLLRDVLFCFNHAPMSPNIYNYRTATHTCDKCRFNTPECCSNHGKVVSADTAGVQQPSNDTVRHRGCLCDQGWTGVRCETSVTDAAPSHAEL